MSTFQTSTMRVYFGLLWITLVSCLTLPIKDNSYPNLVVDDTVQVSWTSGFVIEMFLTCGLIGFTRFGIRCIAHEKESTIELRVKSSESGQCQAGQNRELDDIYNDFSLCNLGENVDVIYNPQKNLIYWSEYRRNTPILEIIASILIIVMTILACESLIQKDTKLRDNTIICLVSFGCAILMLLNVDGRKYTTLTWEDDLFYLFSVLYILFGILAWSFIIFQNNAHSFPVSQRYGINSGIATVHLLSSIMLAGPDNPYSSSFFIIYLFRFLCKVREWDTSRPRDQSIELSLFSNLVVLADLLFCAITFQLCVINQFPTKSDVYLYTIGLYSIAETVSYLYLKE